MAKLTRSSGLTSKSNVLRVASMYEMRHLNNGLATSANIIYVEGYHAGSNLGGGPFCWYESLPAGIVVDDGFAVSAVNGGFFVRTGSPEDYNLFCWGAQYGVDITPAMCSNMLNSYIVNLPEGRFEMTNVLRVPSGRTIRGYSQNATLIVRKSAINVMFINDGDGVTGGWSANHNIEYKSFSIDCNRNEYADSCTPISFGHCDTVLVEDVFIYNVSGRWHAIELNAVRFGVVRNCRFNNVGQDDYAGECVQVDYAAEGGGFPWFGPYDNTGCSNIIVEGCRFEQCSTAVGCHTNLPGRRTIDIVIRNNYMAVSKAGIVLQNWSGVRIHDNRVVYEKWAAGADTAKFYGILVQALQDQTLRDITINDNTVVRDQENTPGRDHRGIQVSGLSNMQATAGNVLINNNIVRGCYRTAISLDNVLDCIIDGNMVAQLGTYASGEGPFAGIAAYGCTSAVVRNNYVRDTYGISITNGARGSRMANTSCTGNTVEGSNITVNMFTRALITGNYGDVQAGDINVTEVSGNLSYK